MHRRHRHGELVKASQVVRNPLRPKVVVLTQVEHLADHFVGEGPR
jgi:hypothetical protein